MTQSRRVVAVCAGLVVVMSAVGAGAQDLVATLEAEFLERFTQFIEWPSRSSVADPSVPFVIGVSGHPAVSGALNKMAAAKRIKGKTLEVREIVSPAQASACQVVFVGRGEAGRLQEILAAVAGKPILVVADTPGYASRGVMINFLTEGDFVRFEVNPKSAEAAGLRMAAELLALGVVVN